MVYGDISCRVFRVQIESILLVCNAIHAKELRAACLVAIGRAEDVWDFSILAIHLHVCTILIDQMASREQWFYLDKSIVRQRTLDKSIVRQRTLP
jgi:hypothetical protein